MRRKMHRMHALLMVLAVLAGARANNRYENYSIYYTEPPINSSSVNYSGLYELHGGHIVRSQKVLSRSRSPYLLREDLFVEKEGELVIEPGVRIHFGPMVGITVRGVITAEVNKNLYWRKITPIKTVRIRVEKARWWLVLRPRREQRLDLVQVV